MSKKTNSMVPSINAALTVGVLITGTGSIYPLESAAHWREHIEHRSSLTLESITPSEPDIDVRTPKEHLDNIRAILNPPIAELAALFDVSRQAVYKWLARDSRPEVDKLERIKMLSRVADDFKKAGIIRAGILLNMKNFDGTSLFDLLKANQPCQEHIKMLIAEAQAMEASYQRSGLAQSNAKPTNDWMSSISIPAYREEIEG